MLAGISIFLFLLFLFLRHLERSHYNFLCDNKERGFVYAVSIGDKPCPKYSVPYSKVFRNRDGDYEYNIDFHKFKSFFHYPIYSHLLLCRGELKFNDSFLNDYEKMMFINKLKHAYNCYYRFVLLRYIRDFKYDVKICFPFLKSIVRLMFFTTELTLKDSRF